MSYSIKQRYCHIYIYIYDNISSIYIYIHTLGYTHGYVCIYTANIVCKLYVNKYIYTITFHNIHNTLLLIIHLSLRILHQ